MTKDKGFKKLVRQRAGKTGESYTAARAQLMAQAKIERYPVPRDVVIENCGDPAYEILIEGHRVTIVFDDFVEQFDTFQQLKAERGLRVEDIRQWPKTLPPLPLPSPEQLARSMAFVESLKPESGDSCDEHERKKHLILAIDESLARLYYPELKLELFGYNSD